MRGRQRGLVGVGEGGGDDNDDVVDGEVEKPTR